MSLWQAYRAARRNVLELIPAAAYRERIVAGGAGPKSVMLVDPDGIERVFRSAASNYPRSRAAMRMMKPRRGNNIVTVTGEAWRVQRKAMVPTFQPRALDGHSVAMTAAAEATSAHIAASEGREVDIFPFLLAATRDVICDLALSGEAIDRVQLSECIERDLSTVTRFSILDVLGLPNWVPRPGSFMNRARARLDAMAAAVVEQRRRRGPCDPPDLLDALLMAEDDGSGRGITVTDVRNNVLALLFAGHETTALSLAWALYLVSIDPTVQEKGAELAQDVLGERAATAADLPALGYVRQIVEESLRLYPPAAVLSRMAAEDDVLAGQPVEAGTSILVPVYALHRHVDFWSDPENFDPSRFAGAAKAGRPRFSYLPFGAGPRICVGAEFAMMEATIVLSTLLARWRFRLADGFEPVPRMWFTLRPATGVVVRASARA